MSRKLLFIILFSVLIFFPLAKASATQVYVGLQITSASAPAYSGGTNNNWCLPGGVGGSYTSSGVVITTDDNCSYKDNNSMPSDVCLHCNDCVSAVSPSSNPTYITSPVCSGNTMWSGLVNLTNGTDYQAYLFSPNFCSGYFLNGWCIETNGENKNCNDICSHYGSTPLEFNNSSCYLPNYANNCDAIAALKGSPCSSCSHGSYSYYSTTTNACWYDNVNLGDSFNCSASPGLGYVRACACLNNAGSGSWTGFSFPFTASF